MAAMETVASETDEPEVQIQQMEAAGANDATAQEVAEPPREPTLLELLEGFVEQLPEEHPSQPIEWIEKCSMVRTLNRLVLESAEATADGLTQPRLLESLLERGWRLAGSDPDTALHRAWTELSDAVLKQIRS